MLDNSLARRRSFASARARITLMTLTMGLWATAASAQHLSNHPVPSSVSGNGTPNRTLVKPASANDAVHAVSFGEDSDDPCYFQVKFRDVATFTDQGSLTFSECDGHKVGDIRTVSLPRGVFATGVRICLNTGEDKLKGIQLIAAYRDCILGAETVAVASSCTVNNISGVEYRVCNQDASPYTQRSCSLPVTSYFERPNCRGSRHDEPDQDWEKIVSCPNGMIATGMKLHARDGSGDRNMIDGVQLQCDTLVPGN
jgi:hypothetical protein